MVAHATTFAVVAAVALFAVCGGGARAQDMDKEDWSRFIGGGGGAGVTLLPQSDVDQLEFPLNLEYLETEFFCWSALGYGLDGIDSKLTGGGPAPIGAQIANLTPLIRDIATQFCYQEVGHLRAIKNTVKGFSRPQLDISAANFGKIVDQALNRTLNPPFNPYENSVNFLLASYLFPYVGLTGYVGSNPKLITPQAKKRCWGWNRRRTLLYENATLRVESAGGVGVAELTLRNALGRKGVKDEGLVVPREQGPEGKTTGNIIAGDRFSLAYDRTPDQVLGIVYGSGDPAKCGGFFPRCADGRIARSYIA
uniref:Desiccation-related protein PCC13-62 n=1 Tax=Leersia perrieri TaxID=77586 RepID=A0A0D9W4I6_9ORYZ